MESPYLKIFLQKIGNSVHNINTIIVGLDGVEKGISTKADSLTITWNPKDYKLSARSARKFVIYSSLVFISDAIKQYVQAVMKNPLFKDDFQDITTDKFNEKFALFSNKFTFKSKYWVPSVVLLLHWRNKVVHPTSNARLTNDQIKILSESKDEIRDEHANTDILETLNHFATQSITLKDISTLIAITIKTIRAIDEQLKIEYKKTDEIINELKNIEKYDEYLEICKEQNSSIQERKLNHFISLYFHELDKELSKDFLKQSLGREPSTT